MVGRLIKFSEWEIQFLRVAINSKFDELEATFEEQEIPKFEHLRNKINS